MKTLLAGTENIIASSDKATYKEFIDSLFERIEKKIALPKKKVINKKDSVQFDNLVFKCETDSYHIRMWDVRNIKGGVKVKYTLYKEI